MAMATSSLCISNPCKKFIYRPTSEVTPPLMSWEQVCCRAAL